MWKMKCTKLFWIVESFKYLINGNYYLFIFVYNGNLPILRGREMYKTFF